MNIEKRNLIVSILVIVLISGGVYYLIKTREVPESNPRPEEVGESEEVEDNKLNEVIPATEEASNEAPKNTSVSGGVSTSTLSTNQAKFNSAMASGHAAFSAKDYSKAISYYKTALTYNFKKDFAYAALFTVYGAQGDWSQARTAIDNAIVANSANSDYWKWKLTLLDERTNAAFFELKQVYESGLVNSDPQTKVNLVTHFALIAEGNKEINEAITAWEFAKQLNPSNSAAYQAEIDRLRAI
jgi:tetratricopeptide (TPR) repeat protein